MGFRRPTWLCASVAALVIAGGCGGAEKTSGEAKRPVDFAYELHGEQHRLAELRGRPLLLVFVRISEVASEMHIYQVVEAYPRSAGEARYLVLTLEPTEEPLLDSYVDYHELPFPIGVAEWAVAGGQSDLGIIPLVPTTVFVDRDGRVASAFAGAVPADELVRELERLGWR